MRTLVMIDAVRPDLILSCAPLGLLSGCRSIQYASQIYKIFTCGVQSEASGMTQEIE